MGHPGRGSSAGHLLGAHRPAAFQQRVRKTAARRRVGRARELALEHDLVALAAQRRDRATGTAEISDWVYGWLGVLVDLGLGPVSTNLPRYITATRSEMCRTTDRSWAMKMYDRP